jgi:hypothetical protein
MAYIENKLTGKYNIHRRRTKAERKKPSCLSVILRESNSEIVYSRKEKKHMSIVDNSLGKYIRKSPGLLLGDVSREGRLLDVNKRYVRVEQTQHILPDVMRHNSKKLKNK